VGTTAQRDLLDERLGDAVGGTIAAEGEARPPRYAGIVKAVFPDAPVTLER
jgi:hypothetical protein